jgi:hypothetical protein
VIILILSLLLGSRPGAQDGLGKSPGEELRLSLQKGSTLHLTQHSKDEPILGTWMLTSGV